MTDRYADGQLATGANDGTSWADAHQGAAGLQAALDAAVAGDTVHLTRTFTLAASLDVDQHDGADGNPIRVVGYNYNGGSPVNDGTRAVIDAKDAAACCLNVNDRDYWHWLNVEFANAVGDNVNGSAGNPFGHVWLNCLSRDAGAEGWGAASAWNSGFWLLCEAKGCTNSGFADPNTGCLYWGCSSHDNGGYGFYGYAGYYTTYAHCAAWGNTSDGFRARRACLIGCVADDNGTDGFSGSGLGPFAVLASRLTRHSGHGIAAGGFTVVDLFCALLGNGAPDDGTGHYLHTCRDAETRIITGEQGYEDAAAGKLNLRVGAAGYRTEIALADGLNFLRLARGLPTSVVPDFSKMGGKQR